MIKTFFVGVLLGIAALAGVLYVLPVVDQHREVSYVSVAPNGGNRESFHINIPVDRVMVGAPGQSAGLPAGLNWPQDEVLQTVSTEMFKVRNERNVVIGVAARTVAQEEVADVIDWVVHIPARGTLMFGMQAEPEEGGQRIGELRAGTREFSALTGFVAERWVSDTSGEEDAPDGRIELHTNYVSTITPELDAEPEPEVEE